MENAKLVHSLKLVDRVANPVPSCALRAPFSRCGVGRAPAALGPDVPVVAAPVALLGRSRGFATGGHSRGVFEC